jgi:hypothetical protein
VWDLFFVCQELIDVLAVSTERILAISDSYHHGIEFIRIERKKETGNTNEIKRGLPKMAHHINGGQAQG